MKKIISTIITLTLLVCMFTVCASMASRDEGVYFETDTMYSVDGYIAADPVTVEATLFFNKRAANRTSNGYFFGNVSDDESAHNIDFGINPKGQPLMRIRNNDKIYTLTFDQVDIRTSEWVHVTIVRDVAKKEARCYIDGTLAQTLPMLSAVEPFAKNCYKIGTNMEFFHRDQMSPNDAIKTLAVYSDVRSDKEIKSDVSKVGAAELILHYDFSNIGNNYPAVVADQSKYKNDARINRFFDDEPSVKATDYAYTFAFLGDTQTMAIEFPNHFSDMYNYIYDNIDAMNIEAVLGLGDVTDTPDGVDAEWNTALAGHKIIDDYVLNIPLIGDHDNIIRYNKFAKQLNYANKAVLYQSGDYRNAYVTADIGGVPYLFLQFQKGPGDAILAWADGVLKAHPNHNVIITTHAYLYRDGEPMGADDMHIAKMDNLADAMWNKFISKHENIVMVVCGHIGMDYVVTNQRKGEKGNIVTEVLIDFQSSDNFANIYNYSRNGLGLVNMFHFSEDGKTVTINTYSTVLKKYFMSVNQLTLELDIHNATKYVKPEKAPTPPRGEATKTEIKMTINSKVAYVNGEVKTLDAAPIIKNSRTLLPVRFLAENLGAEVAWNDATKTATLKTSDTTIEVTINANSMKVNGAAVALDSPAIIENSRTYLPLRAIANALGVSNDNITWDDSTKTATFVK